MKGASRGLEGGLRRASRGLQRGFKPFSPSCPPPAGRDPSSPPLKGTFEGGGSDPAPGRIRRLKRTVPFTFRSLKGGLKGGLQGGLQALLKGASRGLQGSLKGASPL